MRKEDAGNFVNGFVTQRSEYQPDFATGKIPLHESGKLSCRRRIVCAIKINVRFQLDLF